MELLIRSLAGRQLRLRAGGTEPPTAAQVPARRGGMEAVGSPRDWIRSIERLRNADSVATLVRPPELSR